MPLISASSLRAIPEENIRNRDSALSKAFSAAKWVLALTVVADHFFRTDIINAGSALWDTSDFTGYGFLCAFVESFLKNYAVPVFFFMSGYLTTAGESPTYRGWTPTLRRRLRGLAIPFLLFSLFGFLMQHSAYLPGFLVGKHTPEVAFAPYFPGGTFDIRSFLLDTFGLTCYFPLHNVPLWYMRDLACLLLLLPLLHRLLKKAGASVVLGLLCLTFLLTFRDSHDIRPQVGLCFFTAGYWMRWRGIGVTRLFGAIFPYAVILYPLLASFHMVCADSHPLAAALAKNINICLGIPLTIYGLFLCTKNGWITGSRFLVAASFFIYVMHSGLIWIFRLTFLRLLPSGGTLPHPAVGTIVLVAAFLALIAFILLLYRIASQLTPRLTAFASGSRA